MKPGVRECPRDFGRLPPGKARRSQHGRWKAGGCEPFRASERALEEPEKRAQAYRGGAGVEHAQSIEPGSPQPVRQGEVHRNDRKLSDFDAQVEPEQRPPELPHAEIEFTEHAGKAEAVQQAERKREPGAATAGFREAGAFLPAWPFTAGSLIVNAVPLPTVLSTRIRP